MELVQPVFYPVIPLTLIPEDDQSTPYLRLGYAPAEDEQQYFEEFDKHAHTNELDWATISLYVESQANLESQNPSINPSRDFTVDKVYIFYLEHLRPNRKYTNFTFIAVDAACVRSNPKQCIICCDAPDHGEADGEIRLKQLRLPIEKALSVLSALEQLAMTPSEVENPIGPPMGMIWHILPQPFLMPLNDKRDEGAMFRQVRIATPEEARANKAIGISRDGRRDDRKTTAVGVPPNECILIARMEKKAFDLFKQFETGPLETDASFVIPLEGDGGPLEDGDVLPPGMTGVIIQPSIQSIIIYYGDHRGSHHMGHYLFRQKCFPSENVDVLEEGSDEEFRYESGDE